MPAYYNEFEPKTAAWLRELIRQGLIAGGEVDERSIVDVDADDLRGFTQCHFFAGIGGWSYALRLAGWPDDQPVWTGSPPCQPFSPAGKQEGKDDDRHLAPHFAALVAAGRPPILFGEQVASAAVFGKIAKKPRAAPDGAPVWAWIDDLQDRLEAAHYAFGVTDLPAAGIGAPHIRQRTFFGAVRLDHPDSVGRVRRLSIEAGRGAALSAAQRPGDDDGLADAASIGWGEERANDGRGSTGVVSEGRAARPDAGSNADRLADADGEQRDEGLQQISSGSAERLGGDSEPRRVGDPHSSGSQEHRRPGDLHLREPDRANTGRQHINSSVLGGLAHAGRERQDGEQVRVQRRGPQQEGAEAARSGGSDGLADADSDGGWRGRSGALGGAAAAVQREAGQRERVWPDTGSSGSADDGARGPSPLDGFWRDADWLYCRDGKWRPVEPGTFPLAHGLPARVVRLCGYGNAIVPQAAAAFVMSFMEALDLSED